MKDKRKSALKTFNHGERGAALPIVLIMLLLAGLLIAPLMSLIGTSLVAGRAYEANSQELYAADAGVMDACWFLEGLELSNLGEIDPEFLKQYFGEDGTGTYTHTLTEKINGLTVSYNIVLDPVYLGLADFSGFIITCTATGTDSSTTTIETRVHYQDPAPLYMAAGATDGDLTMNGTIVAGDEANGVGVYAKEWINLIGGTLVNGDAYYTEIGGIFETDPPDPTDPTDTGMITGSRIESGELEIAEEKLPPQPTKEIPQQTVATDKSLGNVYIKGNLMVTGNAHLTLTGPVWVAGTITVLGDASIGGRDANNEPYHLITKYTSSNISDLAISVAGANPSGYPYKVDALCIALNGSMKVAGGLNFNGCAIGTTTDVSGNATLTNPIEFRYVDPYRPMVKTYWKIL